MISEKTFSVDELIKLMDTYKIRKSIVWGFGTVSGSRKDKCFSELNNFVAQAIKKYPERLVGFARINPRCGDLAVKELQRSVKKLGFKGFKLHPDENAFPANDKIVHPLLEEAGKMKIPVNIHSGETAWYYGQYGHPALILDLAETFPDVKIIMGHMRPLADAIVVAKKCPNVFLDSAPGNGPPPDAIERAAIAVGADRVIYGSGLPIHGFPGFELWKLERARLSKEEKKKILWDNMTHILEM